MARPHLRELQDQLNLVKEKIAEIHIPKGALAPRISPELLERRKRLVARKKELEERIIFYDPPDK